MPKFPPKSLADSESKPTAIKGAFASTLVPSASETNAINILI